jgi:hypothetical protein
LAVKIDACWPYFRNTEQTSHLRDCCYWGRSSPFSQPPPSSRLYSDSEFSRNKTSQPAINGHDGFLIGYMILFGLRENQVNIVDRPRTSGRQATDTTGTLPVATRRSDMCEGLTLRDSPCAPEIKMATGHSCALAFASASPPALDESRHSALPIAPKVPFPVASSPHPPRPRTPRRALVPEEALAIRDS